MLNIPGVFEEEIARATKRFKIGDRIIVTNCNTATTPMNANLNGRLGYVRKFSPEGFVGVEFDFPVSGAHSLRGGGAESSCWFLRENELAVSKIQIKEAHHEQD